MITLKSNLTLFIDATATLKGTQDDADYPRTDPPTNNTQLLVENVTVENCLVRQSIVANGLKFGTASYGSFKNVTFEDITVDNVDKAAMAVESVDGADISNIVFRRITVHGAGAPFFILLGDRGTTPTGDVHKVGSVDSIHFEDVTPTASSTTGHLRSRGRRCPTGRSIASRT